MAFDCNIIQLRLDGCSQVSREGWWDWPLILLAGQGSAEPCPTFVSLSPVALSVLWSDVTNGSEYRVPQPG